MSVMTDAVHFSSCRHQCIGMVDRSRIIEAVINCNEVDACMSASTEPSHRYDCHSVTALPDPEALLSRLTILKGSKELMSLLSGM